MAIVIDTSEVDVMLARLEQKELRKMTKRAFRAAGNIIKSAAVKNYKEQFPGSERWRAIYTLPFRDGGGAYIKPLQLRKMSARRIMSTVKAIGKRDGSVEAAVKATRGAFILPMLEGGTGVRKSRGRSRAKVANRGSVRAYKFFEAAVNATAKKAQEKWDSVIVRYIEKGK